jgi:hypothetical protein
MARNLEIDPATRDLVVSDYQLALIEGSDYLAQKIESTLRWFRGEWFLDREGGVPWFQSILGKQDLNEVNSIFLSVVSGVEGVARVISFETQYIGATREYRVSFEVLSDEGEIAEGIAEV